MNTSENCKECASLLSTDREKLRHFERLIRSVGPSGFKKLENTHLAVVGVGGVGSWAAEALARSAVGRITLLDFDRVNPSNLNRQLPCLAGCPELGAESTAGLPKTQVMARRLRSINPWSTIDALETVYCPQTADLLWDLQPDIVLDCIDNITYKCHLLNSALQRELPIVCSTGAGGRSDPTKIKVCDLSHTRNDPVALQVRKKLRRDYAFPSNRSFRIPAVYSEELPRQPFELPPQLFQDAGEAEDPLAKVRLLSKSADNAEDDEADSSCLAMGQGRHAPPCGTFSFVTGAFGLTAASLAVKLILADFSLKDLYK
ncbi:tRNA threonylcarbamoyladenosine dehydratase [bacterium]|nr:tRNA threonylcarbamoyladenosine dehydratase [bacterium]